MVCDWRRYPERVHQASHVHAYAGRGDAASAIREGQKAMAIDPTSSYPFEGSLAEESMAQIYAMLGDADHAIPILEKWIQVPSFTEITPSMLRVSTIWDPIRNDPFSGIGCGKEIVNRTHLIKDDLRRASLTNVRPKGNRFSFLPSVFERFPRVSWPWQCAFTEPCQVSTHDQFQTKRGNRFLANIRDCFLH